MYEYVKWLMNVNETNMLVATGHTINNVNGIKKLKVGSQSCDKQIFKQWLLM